MTDTYSGISIDVSDVHPLKHDDPIVRNASGKSIEANDSHP